MKILKLTLLTFIMGFSGLGAMQQAAPARGQLPVQVQTQNLYIKNNSYPDQIKVTYVRADSKAQAPIVLGLGHEGMIPNVRDVIDIRFEAYGKYKQYLNFATSPNHMIKLNAALAEDKTGDFLYIIDAAKTWSEEEERAAVAQEAGGPQSLKELMWSYAGAAYEGTKKLLSGAAKAVITRVGPFKINLEPVTKPEEKKLRDEAYEGRTLADAFAQVKCHLSGQTVSARYVLNLPPGEVPVNIREREQAELHPWERKLEQAISQGNPRSKVYFEQVIKMIKRAADNPKEEIPVTLFTERY